MAFDLARWLEDRHLIVQPCDARLNPPQSYLFVQDGLIIICGALYALCYIFYMARTVRDKRSAGGVQYLGLTMAFELFYALKITSTSFELWAFTAWFALDISFTALAIRVAYAPSRRLFAAGQTLALLLGGVAFLHVLCQYYPDDREQLTAYWTGIALQLPISVGSVWVLLSRRETKGHSVEIWLTRYLGCYFAYAVFWWRYWNIPENWAYVASPWGLGIIGVTLLAETVWPGIYVWVYLQERRREREDEADAGRSRGGGKKGKGRGKGRGKGSVGGGMNGSTDGNVRGMSNGQVNGQINGKVKGS